MKKGEQTRQRILAQAAALFNQHGYFGTSLEEVLAVTGLQKGGLYRHFPSKEALALEAFQYAIGLMGARYMDAMATQTSATDKLKAMVREVLAIGHNPPLPGGCPVLNTSVESDDAIPFLRDAVLEANRRWFQLIETTVQAGQAAGELPASIDPEKVAHILIAGLEGGIYQAQLFKDLRYMQHTVNHLVAVIDLLPQEYPPCTKSP